MLRTTLKELRRHNVCRDRYEYLIDNLPSGFGYEQPLSLLKILEIKADAAAKAAAAAYAAYAAEAAINKEQSEELTSKASSESP